MTVEENIGGNLCELEVVKDFLDMTEGMNHKNK